MAVLDPLKLKLVNWAEVFRHHRRHRTCQAPAHPHRPELEQRRFELGPEAVDRARRLRRTPPKGFFRLFPGNKVRLKCSVVVVSAPAAKGCFGRRDRGAREGGARHESGTRAPTR